MKKSVLGIILLAAAVILEACALCFAFISFSDNVKYDGLVIVQEELPIDEHCRRGDKLESISNIILYDSGTLGQTAQETHDFFASLAGQEIDQGRYCSYHFSVGLDGEVIESLPLDEAGWHANNMHINLNSIGVGFSYSDESGKPNDETYASLVKLVAYLCKTNNLSVDNVIRQFDANESKGPKWFYENENKFEVFKQDVQKVLDGKAFKS